MTSMMLSVRMLTFSNLMPRLKTPHTMSHVSQTSGAVVNKHTRETTTPEQNLKLEVDHLSTAISLEH